MVEVEVVEVVLLVLVMLMGKKADCFVSRVKQQQHLQQKLPLPPHHQHHQHHQRHVLSPPER